MKTSEAAGVSRARGATLEAVLAGGGAGLRFSISQFLNFSIATSARGRISVKREP